MLHQCHTEGRLWLALLGAEVLVLNYVVPCADRSWRARVEHPTERYVVEHGWGALAGFLHR